MALSKRTKDIMVVALADKKAGEELAAAADAAGAAAEAVEDIADPATATAEDVANKVNELLASLRAAGKLAE